MTTNSASASLSPSDRLLCGPGPTNVSPAALAAMQQPMLGHMDAEMHEILLETVRMLRLVYRNAEGLVLPLQATGTTGMETGLVNLTEPGDTVIVGASGYFGRRIAEIARRVGYRRPFAFSNAFRRAYPESPRRYRERALAGR